VSRNIKAKHSAQCIFLKQYIVYQKTKVRATFVPVSAFLVFVVSAVAHGEKCAILGIFGLFFAFSANFAAIKKTFSSARIILVLDATCVSNLTFLGLLAWIKPSHRPDTQLISPSVNFSMQCLERRQDPL